jgi:hypothetical protein
VLTRIRARVRDEGDADDRYWRALRTVRTALVRRELARF